MIITEELCEIEEQAEKLIEAILTSHNIKLYKKNRHIVQHSIHVQEKKQKFLKAREQFEQIEVYGKYVPEFKKKQRELRMAKRVLDLTEEIAEFRLAETAIQTILDNIGIQLSQAISKDIKVETGNPFFEKGKKSSCGGNCHAS